MKITRYPTLLALSASLLTLAGCQETLDKEDLTAASEALVFQNESLAFLNLSYIYDQNLTNWFGLTGQGLGNTNPSGLSEEVASESKYFEGTITQNDVTDFGTSLNATNNYGKLRTINTFIRAINQSPIPSQPRNLMKGEAMFFRAWRYFDLVRVYGGVPLVLTPLDGVGEEAREAAKLPRNTTTETYNQIITDLDSAIAYLPGKWPSASWGRITKGAAAAFKARVLLTAASPQFNPSDDVAKWQRAFDASKEAKAILDANGFGLHASYDQLWFQEVNNPEAVLVTGYNNSQGAQNRKNNGYDNSTRPAYTGTSGTSNLPTWDIVQAYPMLDGKKPGESTAYPYSMQLFYKNRDPRFDKTIAYNGCTWPLNGNNNFRLWTYLRGTTSVEPSKPTNTSFYLRKAINPTLAPGDVQFAGTDWIELRYAEVLLNLAESACGANNLNEAYTQLKAIRKRAGILPGTGTMYGLTAGMSRAQMFDAILYERQIELAFEGKRFWDLRRWKLIEQKLNGMDKLRKGLTITLKTTAPANFATIRDNLPLDSLYRNYFTITTNIRDTRYQTLRTGIQWKPEYYFFAIPQSAIDNNPNLIQNNGVWGGAFDPLR
ncbi:RagB/SusD family nutrient uptake outer membrane protein [Hymenobacter aerilatus]|uniref:RagB/SusD family nutrient uptake outer membrane protein n=1 Tax=Hymenobacter aerilatus TaxID=2932251 RepID=A0A8T9SUY3_9BACT|nr:RagB/SusD family nutrient uptake outer membrane protein [Hymenobacter aerilatus]UOR03586.1 RagB/SusD family nutrient uptake outer membrane protein [Hymenobacter aerilatus]